MRDQSYFFDNQVFTRDPDDGTMPAQCTRLFNDTNLHQNIVFGKDMVEIQIKNQSIESNSTMQNKRDQDKFEVPVTRIGFFGEGLINQTQVISAVRSIRRSRNQPQGYSSRQQRSQQWQQMPTQTMLPSWRNPRDRRDHDTRSRVQKSMQLGASMLSGIVQGTGQVVRGIGRLATSVLARNQTQIKEPGESEVKPDDLEKIKPIQDIDCKKNQPLFAAEHKSDSPRKKSEWTLRNPNPAEKSSDGLQEKAKSKLDMSFRKYEKADSQSSIPRSQEEVKHAHKFKPDSDLTNKLRVVKPKVVAETDQKMLIVNQKSSDPKEAQKKVVIQQISCLYEESEAQFYIKRVENGDITEAMLEQIRKRRSGMGDQIRTNLQLREACKRIQEFEQQDSEKSKAIDAKENKIIKLKEKLKRQREQHQQELKDKIHTQNLQETLKNADKIQKLEKSFGDCQQQIKTDIKGLSEKISQSGLDSDKKWLESIERSVGKIVEKSSETIVQKVMQQTRIKEPQSAVKLQEATKQPETRVDSRESKVESQSTQKEENKGSTLDDLMDNSKKVEQSKGLEANTTFLTEEKKEAKAVCGNFQSKESCAKQDTNTFGKTLGVKPQAPGEEQSNLKLGFSAHQEQGKPVQNTLFQSVSANPLDLNVILIKAQILSQPRIRARAHFSISKKFSRMLLFRLFLQPSLSNSHLTKVFLA